MSRRRAEARCTRSRTARTDAQAGADAQERVRPRGAKWKRRGGRATLLRGRARPSRWVGEVGADAQERVPPAARNYDILSKRIMVPETSTTLLRSIHDADSARWPEFVSRYCPMMMAYVGKHFPRLDADDIVQETLVALSKVIVCYRYAPDETGRFRNYLTGILRKKALKQCEKVARERSAKEELRNMADASVAVGSPDDSAVWKDAILEIAMRQLLDDGRIPDKSKQIFQRLTIDGAAPDEVAAAYGTSRNNIDKTKSRMIARLREIVRALEEVGDVRCDG